MQFFRERIGRFFPRGKNTSVTVQPQVENHFQTPVAKESQSRSIKQELIDFDTSVEPQQYNSISFSDAIRLFDDYLTPGRDPKYHSTYVILARVIKSSNIIPSHHIDQGSIKVRGLDADGLRLFFCLGLLYEEEANKRRKQFYENGPYMRTLIRRLEVDLAGDPLLEKLQKPVPKRSTRQPYRSSNIPLGELAGLPREIYDAKYDRE